jgi:hypothetical protein
LVIESIFAGAARVFWTLCAHMGSPPKIARYL